MPNFSKVYDLSEAWLSELDTPIADPDIYFDEEGQESALTIMGHLLREILYWLTEGNRNRGGYATTVARKTIAMAWVLRPEIFDGASLTAICAAKGIDLNPKAFSVYATQFSDRFGIRHAGQKTPEARIKYAAAQLNLHKKDAKE